MIFVVQYLNKRRTLGAAFNRGRRLLIFWLSGVAFNRGRRLFEEIRYSIWKFSYNNKIKGKACKLTFSQLLRLHTGLL